MLDSAIDQGINIIDTADYYGDGTRERVLGRLLTGRRDRVIVTSKVGLRTAPEIGRVGLSRRHILLSIYESLTRLATDWIDLYLVHRTDPLTPLEETLDALDHVVRQGKVRYIGYCN